MATRVVVCRVFLARNQQLGMEQLSVIARADLVNRGGVEVDEDRTRDVFSAARLCEHSIELAAIVEGLRIGVGTSILLEAVLEQVAGYILVGVQGGISIVRYGNAQFPRTVSELRTGLADMEMKNLSPGARVSTVCAAEPRAQTPKGIENKHTELLSGLSTRTYLSSSHLEDELK
jgi:hypothetical protein